MSLLELQRVDKSFGTFMAVKEVSLAVENAEFVSLLGPSGCGKTTTLRMIAGLEKPTRGQILLRQEPVADPANGVFVPPEHRNIGMVFQSYAIWPHMNVFSNIAYPLKIKKLAKETIRERVHAQLELVNLGGLEDRMPNQLSGGQQQRVALARGLIMEPSLLLLDEPLSNLDAKLRLRMREEIRDIAERMKVAMVYVTHDQAEAMAISDRVAVMNEGGIVQCAPPDELRNNPADAFVKEFLN